MSGQTTSKTKGPTRYLRRLVDLSTNYRRLTGLAVARVVLGVAGIYTYLSGYQFRDFLWGPDGPWSLAQVRADIASFNGSATIPSFSLYAISGSQWWFELVFHLGIVSAVLFTLRGGRLLTAFHWIFLWSLFGRNPLIQDGGNNITIIVLFFLIWTRNDQRLSWRRRQRRTASMYSGPRAAVLVHNAALVLIVFQVAVLYTVSGLWKIAGETWQSGTALYYASNVSAYHFLGFLDPLIENPFITTGLAWSVIALESAYPLLILNTRTRLTVVILAILMHLGIAAKMGLLGFLLAMTGANAAVLAESDYEALRRLAKATRTAFANATRWARRSSRKSSDQETDVRLDAPGGCTLT